MSDNDIIHPASDLRQRLPDDMLDRPQWVCWEPVLSGGKITKPPRNPITGRYAKTSEPNTWGTFETAWAAYRRSGRGGIGFVFTTDDCFVGIDLDDCLNPTSGEVCPWAKSIVDRMNSYTEVSPYRRGVHIIARGVHPGSEQRDGKGFEIYGAGQYFTITGVGLGGGDPGPIQERQGQIEAVYAERFPSSSRGSLRTARQEQPRRPWPVERKQLYSEGDIETGLARAGVEPRKTSGGGSTKWTLACPFVEDHSHNSTIAYIELFHGGGVCAKCHGGRCGSRGWDDFREWLGIPGANSGRETTGFRHTPIALQESPQNERSFVPAAGEGAVDTAQSPDGQCMAMAKSTQKRCLNAALQGSDRCKSHPVGQSGEKDLPASEELARFAERNFEIRLGVRPVAIPKEGPRVIQPLSGRGAICPRLSHLWRKAYGWPPTNRMLTDAIRSLEGEALSMESEDFPLRCHMRQDGAVPAEVIVDVGDREGNAIVISKTGWKVVTPSPVPFRRSTNLRPLPLPQRSSKTIGKRLELLRDLLPVPRESFPIFVGWLASTFFPGHDTVILYLRGAKGSGKSTLANFLARLADPQGAQSSQLPAKKEDWIPATYYKHLVWLDNFSRLTPWQSDGLCLLSTGGGYALRELYTTAESFTVNYRRYVILSAIDPNGVRDDLADRLLPMRVQFSGKRRGRPQLEAAFEEHRPTIYGALLDLVAEVLRRYPMELAFTHPSRMTEFARTLHIIDNALGYDSLTLYEEALRIGAAEVLEDDPVASSIVSLMRGQSQMGPIDATALFKKLRPKNQEDQAGWPKTVGAFGKRIARAEKLLDAVEGIRLERGFHSVSRRASYIFIRNESRSRVDDNGPPLPGESDDL